MASASFKFRSAEGDTVLRTSDKIDLYCYKTILSLASPVFRHILSLPQSHLSTDPLIIEVTEDSLTLSHLLGICYSTADPEIAELKDVVNVLEAAVKYQMEKAVTKMEKMLHGFVTSLPLYVYAIACRLHLCGVASTAAREWYRMCPKVDSTMRQQGRIPTFQQIPIGATYCPEMASISAGALFRLLRFVLDGIIPASFVDPPSTKAPVSSGQAHSFLFQDADLILRASDMAQFHVHKIIISLSSPDFFKKYIPDDTAPLPVISLSEDSVTLGTLLALCYPTTGEISLGNLFDICSILRAAVKYGMQRAVWLVKMQLMDKVASDPLRVYFIAVNAGWKAEAQEAARAWVEKPLIAGAEEQYVPEMEITSALAYHNLLKYHYHCQVSITNVTRIYEKKLCEDWSPDFSDWNKGRYRNGGTASIVPTKISAPVVQCGLRWTQLYGSYSDHPRFENQAEPTGEVVRSLMDVSDILGDIIEGILSNTTLVFELSPTFRPYDHPSFPISANEPVYYEVFPDFDGSSEPPDTED